MPYLFRGLFFVKCTLFFRVIPSFRSRFSTEAAVKTQVTRKKSTPYKEESSKQVEAYLEKIKDIPKEKLVYIDETGIQTQMYRQYARNKRGKRINIRISGKHHVRIGLFAAQREGALLASHTYSGTMKACVFEKWFEDKL